MGRARATPGMENILHRGTGEVLRLAQVTCTLKYTLKWMVRIICVRPRSVDFIRTSYWKVFPSRKMKWWKWPLRKIDLVKACSTYWLGSTRGGQATWDTEADSVLGGERNQDRGGDQKERGMRREAFQHWPLCVIQGKGGHGKLSRHWGSQPLHLFRWKHEQKYVSQGEKLTLGGGWIWLYLTMPSMR